MQYTVGVDGNEANVVNRVGSNVYAYEALHALYNWLQQEKKFAVIVYVAYPPMDDMPKETDFWRYEIVPHAPLWTLWRLPLSLWSKKQIDLFFSPGHYVPVVAPVPVVPTIMDIAYEFFPEQFRQKDLWQLRYLTRLSVAKAEHVFAISESTKQDVVDQYQKQASDVSVAYPGAPKNIHVPEAKQRAAVRKKFALKNPYVAYVGTLQPRKNIIRLVSAFEHLRKTGWNGDLVIAGKIGWQSEGIQEAIDTSSEREHIHQLGFVTDDEKYALMAEAETVVLAGLYEGFGIPPLEAIQVGTIPVVSNVSSLPEVVGEDGVLVDPESPEDIARGIQEVLACNETERKKWLKKLQEHANQFSWKKTGEVIGNTLWEVLSRTRVM